MSNTYVPVKLDCESEICTRFPKAISSRPLISIIIPYKNGLDKLVRLLFSIPKCPDFEIIVIDDDSAEDQNARKVENDWQHITFLQNLSEEKNAGTARNTGLDNANGIWVMFADADDFFTEGAFHEIRKKISCSQAYDCVFFKCTSKVESEASLAKRHLFANSLIDCFSLGEDRLSIRYNWNPPWGKLIRKELIDTVGLRFESLSAANDVGFSTSVGHYARKISTSNVCVYCVTQSSDSLTATLTPERALARLRALTNKNDFLITKQVPIKMDYGFYYFFRSKPFILSLKKLSYYARFFAMNIRRVLK